MWVRGKEERCRQVLCVENEGGKEGNMWMCGKGWKWNFQGYSGA
ncbi:MAG: hypothetical protein ACKESB_01910 [Candidatus Hodgkinia cicadicola]